MPQAIGGKDEEVNLAISCLDCNGTRGDSLLWPPADRYGPEYMFFYNPELYVRK